MVKNKKIFNKICGLGTISYGLYMYHTIVIFLVSIIAKNNILVFLFSIGLSILISQISYMYFESYFLNKKNIQFQNER